MGRRVPEQIEMKRLQELAKRISTVPEAVKCSLALPRFMAIARQWQPVRTVRLGRCGKPRLRHAG